MSLTAGSRLGPYEIVSPLGAGGMGEVYRARDTRLGRDVAVKVIPEELAAHKDRLRRFEQEARAIAALDHPNILAVHDVGTHELLPYIVSELLEGDTLRGQIRGGGLTPRKAVEHAIQIARGLAAAHQRGIVHRDLKPENVFVTRDGHVKILDFGLAKLRDEARSDPEGETVSHVTRPGVILGTVPYLSPEQVRGLPADARSDIFALGSVLYEMLARRRAFTGETTSEIETAILREEPPELSTIDPQIPATLDRIVRRCLEKRPEDRFAAAQDVAFALEALGSGSGSKVQGLLPSQAQDRHRWPMPAVAWGLGLLALGGLLVAVGVRRPGPSEPPAFERVTFRRGAVFAARFAADGETIVFGASWEGAPVEVFSTRRGSRDSRSLGFSPGSLLALSSTGEMALSLEPRWLYSFYQPGVLARAPLAGGVARRLLADVNAADWSPDGAQLAVARATEGGSRIEFPLGKEVYATKGTVGSLRVSPDGGRLAFIEYHQNEARVMMLDTNGQARALSSGWNAEAGGLAWSPSGREVFFSLTRGSVSGDPVGQHQLNAVDVGGRERLILRIPGGVWLHDLARDGRVLLAHTRFLWQLRAGEIAPPVENDLSWFSDSFVEDISSDGRQILFTEIDDLYLRSVDGSPAVKLGTGFGWGALSPDGSRVAAIATAGDRLSLLPTREGETVELPRGSVKTYRQVQWMPDGRQLLFSAEDGEGSRVFLQDLAGGSPRPLTPVGYGNPCPAPDGAQFAARGAKDRIVLQRLSSGSPRDVPGEHPGRELLRWSPDGRWLFAYHQGDLPGRLLRIDLTTGLEEVVRTLMPPDPAAVWRIYPVVVSADSRHYAYSATQNLSDLYVYTGLR
jgi:Tol biopolymer transport system component